jgi:hypothetical protein
MVQALVKKLINKGFRPFWLCLPGVMFVTHGFKNSLQHAQVFHSKTTGNEYKIFCNVNCKTPNVAYLLDCHVCGSQHVNMGNPFVDHFFFVLQEVISVNFTGLWKPTLYNFVIISLRRPKSIKDTLVRAVVSRPSSTVGQCKSCGDKRCNCCLQLQHAQVLYSKTTGKEYKIFCSSDQCILNAFRSPERYSGWFREQLGQRFTFFNFFPMMMDNAWNLL